MSVHTWVAELFSHVQLDIWCNSFSRSVQPPPTRCQIRLTSELWVGQRNGHWSTYPCPPPPFPIKPLVPSKSLKPCLWCDWGSSPREKFAYIHQRTRRTGRKTKTSAFPWWYAEIIVLSTERQTVQLDAPSCRRAAQQWSNRGGAGWLIWPVTSELPYLWLMPLNAKRGLTANSFQLI